MSLHPTLSEECVQFSVKKFFYDGLKAVDGVPIYFAYVFMLPMNSTTGVEHDRWVKFHFDGIYPNRGLSEARVNAYIFSRGTPTVSAGRLLAQTRDLLMTYLVNTDPDGNGLKAIPLLDINDNNNRVSSMVISIGTPTDEQVADDKTLYRLVPIKLKFATV
jgi:hypothetical protein